SLFGDPAGYFSVGERFHEAASRLRAGEDARVVFDSVRGVFYLAGVGLLYGLLDALRPADLAFFRLVMAGFNTLAMLGVFFLARRLSGAFAGGLLALGLAALYPSFALQTGRLYPDPVTGCLFVWAAVFYGVAIDRSLRREPGPATPPVAAHDASGREPAPGGNAGHPG